jgi:DNA-binding response OmpR family regulator
MCRDLLAAILRLTGYQTYTAEDAHEALSVLRERTPDLMLLDIDLPEMDGLAIMRILRSNPQYKDVHCIVLTAVTERDCVLKARKLGAHDYLLKTHFSLDDLMARITRVLGGGASDPPGAVEAEIALPETA